MTPSQTVPVWDRVDLRWPEALGVERCEFTGPDGAARSRPAFRLQPFAFSYDDHGYESAVAHGEAVKAVRFTPDREGRWNWRALKGAEVVATGVITATEPAGPTRGYIEVSREDSRYFRSTDGPSYAPLGLNLCWPPSVALSTGTEFGVSGRRATFGVTEYERWFAKLSAQGGNFARLWLSNPYFCPDTQTAGELDAVALARLDAVVAAARRHGIRLKLCLEHFRALQAGKANAGFVRTIRHPVDGREPAGMGEWFQSDEWRAFWLMKVDALTARHGDDPVIMAWELWNEINCCEQSASWETIRDWTVTMLGELKRRSPRNLATNSLGSLDTEETGLRQLDFHMPAMDFQQVHRYLDQGAELAICRDDPITAGMDAINRARRGDRPVLLAETGAVNDNHSGPFRYYRWDDEGLIFHDVTYPAFFAGAAGSGHIWHWDHYVDQKNLWAGFGALSAVLTGIEVDREHFAPVDLSTAEAWVLVLRGKRHVLGWVRNKADSWQNRLQRQLPPTTLRDVAVDLSPLGAVDPHVELFRPLLVDAEGTARVNETRLELPPFSHGLIFRLQLRSPSLP